MPIKRTELDASLQRVQPALYAKDTVEELGCVWLDGKAIWTFDGEIGLNTGLESDVVGGVKGATLIGIVKSSRAVEVALAQGSADTILVTATGTKIELPLLDPVRRPKWPSALFAATPIPLPKDLIAAIKLGYSAVGKSESRPDFLGTTFLPVEKDLHLYTADGATATWMMCDLPEGWPDHRIAMPRRFCEQLVKLYKDDKDQIIFTPGNAVVELNQDTQLLGRMLEIESPISYPKMLGRLLPEDYEDRLYDIPAGLGEAIGRAKAILAKSKDNSIRLDTDGVSSLTLETIVGSSKADEKLKITKKVQPALAIKLSVPLVERILPHVDQMLLTEACAIFVSSKTGLTHLISAAMV